MTTPTSDFELWHPLEGLETPDINMLLSRCAGEVTAVLLAAARLAAGRIHDEEALEAARRALFEPTWRYYAHPSGEEPGIEPIDLFRAVLAVAPAALVALVPNGEAAFEPLLDDARCRLGRAPTEGRANLESMFARQWALWLAREGLVGPTHLLPACGRDALWVPARVSAPEHLAVGEWVGEISTRLGGDHPFWGPTWLGPPGLLAAVDQELERRSVLLIGGGSAIDLANRVQERRWLRRVSNAGPPHVLVAPWCGNDAPGWPPAIRHEARLLRLAESPARRVNLRFADVLGHGWQRFEVLAGEAGLAVIHPDDLNAVLSWVPDAVGWTRIEVPLRSRPHEFLAGVCQLPCHSGRQTSDRMIDVFLTEAAGGPGAYDNTNCRVHTGIARAARGEEHVSESDAETLASWNVSLHDVGRVVRYVEGLPGVRLPDHVEQRRAKRAAWMARFPRLE